jgi:hypothetical protein
MVQNITIALLTAAFLSSGTVGFAAGGGAGGAGGGASGVGGAGPAAGARGPSGTRPDVPLPPAPSGLPGASGAGSMSETPRPTKRPNCAGATGSAPQTKPANEVRRLSEEDLRLLKEIKEANDRLEEVSKGPQKDQNSAATSRNLAELNQPSQTAGQLREPTQNQPAGTQQNSAAPKGPC